MRLLFFIVFFLASISNTYSQNKIIYDLDSYRRVDFKLRSTFITPDAYVSYRNTLNNPSTNREYRIRLGGEYLDEIITNNVLNQKIRNSKLEFNLTAGPNQELFLYYETDMSNRTYAGSKYFKNGYRVSTKSVYNKNNITNSFFNQEINLNYELGFGFGRLEIINNAWMGARILEELDNNSLLEKLPDALEMREFFDLVGDLEYERVQDPRLRFMHRVEKMITYLEEKEWIAKGSIKAFITIYDAFRFETFFNRESGERLEFSLDTNLEVNYVKSDGLNDYERKTYQPGYLGRIEYSIHRNGDLQYYTIKKLGGTLRNYEKFDADSNNQNIFLSGSLYYLYEYRYIPSLRTNISLSTFAEGKLIYSLSGYNADLRLSSIFMYNYYFTPSTQASLRASLYYKDDSFQIGGYRPELRGTFSFNIVHAIR